jgi:hypothetical protein
MKHKAEEYTQVVDSSPALTIAEFESGKSILQRRSSFQELVSRSQISPQASETINANPILETLNKHELLFFSTEHREATANFISKNTSSVYSKALDQCSPTQKVNLVVQKSLNAFDHSYNSCKSLGQDFLHTSIKILTAKHTDFAGLSIEAIPSFEGKIRSDHYQYDTKQVHICFQPLVPPLNTKHNTSLLLAHELTHAIDDVHSNLNSCKVLFQNLHKNATGSRRKQEAILDCAAKIVDDDKKTFSKFYLPSLKEQWFITEGKRVFHDRTQEWVAAIEENPATNVFVGVDDGKRGLRCGSVPTEFLTFSMEHVFNALKESENPNEFADKYNTIITRALSKVDENGFELEIKKAALELIKDTTSAHLRLLQEHSTSPALSECCDKAINILETQYSSLHSQSVAIARSSSIPEVEDVAPSLKREGSPPDPRDAQSEKKLDMDTKPSASALRQSHPSIQSKLYSKDDSCIENIVEQIRERFKKSEKITNSTAIATSNRNMGPRPLSR